ncbi:MAG: lysophospholipid acyltransferase family protein [Candidatus Fervidibacter sp.]|uniref:lysophospholipid acyltransferase family protein n=1 Tax=Candidatus Fervidibacter sp. TaxID=3100871 RepID=UPI004048EFE4
MDDRMNFLYWLGWYLCRFLAFRLCKLKVEGAERLPASGGVIIASTHTATLDPVILGCAFDRPLTFMAKEELFRFPPFAALIRTLGAFPVKRGEPDRRALKKAISLLRQGRCLVIFPEGTRNPDRQLRQPELGVALLAAWAKVPVLPVAIFGSELLTPKGKFLPRPVPLRVRVGHLLWYKGDGHRDSLKSFTWEVMEAISELSGRPLPSRLESVTTAVKRS